MQYATQLAHSTCKCWPESHFIRCTGFREFMRTQSQFNSLRKWTFITFVRMWPNVKKWFRRKNVDRKQRNWREARQLILMETIESSAQGSRMSGRRLSAGQARIRGRCAGQKGPRRLSAKCCFGGLKREIQRLQSPDF